MKIWNMIGSLNRAHVEVFIHQRDLFRFEVILRGESNPWRSCTWYFMPNAGVMPRGMRPKIGHDGADPSGTVEDKDKNWNKELRL